MRRIEFILNNSRGKILDLGCNTGPLHQILHEKFKYNVVGVDVSPTIRTFNNGKMISRPVPKDWNFVRSDVRNMKFSNNSFNTIICGELIEHFTKKDGIRLLKESKRILKSNGVFILSTPNKNSWINRIFHSYEHSEYKGKPHIHKHLYTTEEIISLVSNYFKVEKHIILPYSSESDTGIKSIWKYFFWSRKLIHYIIPNGLREEIIILATKV